MSQETAVSSVSMAARVVARAVMAALSLLKEALRRQVMVLVAISLQLREPVTAPLTAATSLLQVAKAGDLKAQAVLFGPSVAGVRALVLGAPLN